MLDAPVDAWYAWVGVAAAATVLLGTAVGLPTAPSPDAGRLADTVDAVAGATHDATARHPLDAEAVKLRPREVLLRGPGGVARARLAFGPVTPVRGDGPLARVLAGEPPDAAFSDPAAMRAAARAARDRRATWRRAGTVRVRTVTWEGVDVTLVGT